MRSLLLVALLATLASAHLTKAVEDVRFGDNIAYSLYNGFLKGLYRSSSNEVVSTQCFGDWIQKNLTHIDKVID